MLLLFLFLFHFNPHLTSPSPSPPYPNSSFLCPSHQSHALLQFKSTFTIDVHASESYAEYYGVTSHPKTESWKEGTDCCSSWDGVTCDNATGHVIGLDLSCSQLVGHIHKNNSLFSSRVSPYLRKLNLNGNDFLGSDMTEFGVKFGSSLTRLCLSWSNFSGNVPPGMSQLSHLVVVDFSYNRGLRIESVKVLERIVRNLTRLSVLNLDEINMSSLVLASTSLMNLSSSLTSLRLYRCELQGQFPVTLLLLPNLEELMLFRNNFSPVTSAPDLNSSTKLTSLSLSRTDLSSVSRGFLDFIVNLKSLRYLYLHNCSLVGSIPDSFCNMTQVVDLNLASNRFSGEVPSCLFALPSLQDLRLTSNELGGMIPTSLSNSSNLIVLDLSDNSLTEFPIIIEPIRYLIVLDISDNRIKGPLPVSPSTVEFFSIRNNSFSGPVSSLICNLSSLSFMDFSDNELVGLIPPCLGNLSELLVLNLGMNNLHGTIPDTIGKEKNMLRYLDLNENQLKGKLPPSLSNCRHLKVLDVGNNMIEDVFPRWLVTLSTLQVVVLRSNKFFGSIDSFRSRFSSQRLRILDVSDNNLTGRLPTRLIGNLQAMMIRRNDGGRDYMTASSSTYDTNYYSMTITVKRLDMKYVKILTAFTAIDFSGNGFVGDIPGVIGKLGSLKGLNLSHNLLTGDIPTSLGDLAELEWLDLSSNKLVGRIPRKLADLTFLEVLDLSHNQLDGPIPQGKQFNTFGNESYRENSGLCGFPLSKACGTSITSSERKDSSDSTNRFSWEGAFIGYGCGMLFGVFVGNRVFSSESPQWFVRMVSGKQRRNGVKRSKKNANRGNGRRRN